MGAEIQVSPNEGVTTRCGDAIVVDSVKRIFRYTEIVKLNRKDGLVVVSSRWTRWSEEQLSIHHGGARIVSNGCMVDFGRPEGLQVAV